jgi:phospholipase/carboxylesterase
MTRLTFAFPFASIVLMTLLSSSAHAVDAAGTRAELRPSTPVAGASQSGSTLVDQVKGPVAIKTSQTEPRRLVIFLHGIRGSGSVMAAFGNSWQSILKDTRFVTPDAPFAHRSGGRQWFAIDDQVLRPDRIEGARQAFDGLISGIVEREGFKGDLQSVAFVGVSQGAIMALDAVSSGRWKVGAVVSIAGLLPLPPVPSATKIPMLLMHGAADQTIPSVASVAAAGQLRGAGYDVTLKVYPQVGRTISTEEAREAVHFLRDRFDR